MFPQLHILGLSISTYYTMMFLGFVLMLVLMIRRRARYGLSMSQAILFAFLVLFSGIAGCKILFILENPGEPLSFGGFSFFGAVFLVPVFMALLGWLVKLRPKESISASAPLVCAMVGTIRVGCFLNGCCGGWALKNGFRWPTQAMESIGDFIILFWLLNREDKGDRLLYPKFTLAYSILRFLIEFLRDTTKDWLGLSHGQCFALAAAGVAVMILRPWKKEGTEHE